MSKPAPGRYCLATCYCGECAHYVPIVRHRDTPDNVTPLRPAKTTAWDEREEPTWLDKM